MRRRPISLAHKPLDWIVQAVETPDGLLLYWFRPSLAESLRRVALATSCFAGLPMVAAFEFQPNLFTVLGLVATGMLLLWWLVQWPMCKVRVPEAVFLGPDWLAYYPGSEVRDFRVVPLVPLGRTRAVDPEKIVTLAVQRLRGFALDRVEGIGKLFFDSDCGRQEIGGCLVPAERDWLFALLEQWRLGIDKRGVRDTSIIDAEMASWKKRWSDPETGITDKGRR
ncbi:MAG: hypothetical protein L0Y71_19200 [Gemmataceae bacterium]|nr:hypothetical protein [Gemmataceae bacterium]